MRSSVHLLFLLVCSASAQFVCEAGSVCNDQNSCTGTETFPDVCLDGKCSPGADVCPVYIKPTTIGRSDSTGELQAANDDKWIYILWHSSSPFRASQVHLYVSANPLISDDPETFPFQLDQISDPTAIQMRVSLEYLQYPTEMDPIYLALRLENNAGAGSWMSGYFTPTHHSHGGSYSYTSVCHCSGYSHVKDLVDWSAEIYSFSETSQATLPLEIATASSPSVCLSYLLFAITILLVV